VQQCHYAVNGGSPPSVRYEQQVQVVLLALKEWLAGDRSKGSIESFTLRQFGQVLLTSSVVGKYQCAMMRAVFLRNRSRHREVGVVLGERDIV
jgi:hypothetical protein